MTHNGRLELTWVDKYNRKKIEPRILVENPEKSYGDQNTENMLIHGDNLLALKALEQDYAGKVKCIYIDPPYNTGNAFDHYEDGLEHSIWLNMMRDRLEIMYKLLSDDGSIWISIDDDECHYLKVLCDEIFGRNNFITNIIWQKKYAPQNDAIYFSDTHDHILVYAKNSKNGKKDKRCFEINYLVRTEEQNALYKNRDNDQRGPWMSDNLSVKTLNPRDVYPITTPSGRVVYPPESRSWVVSEKRFNELVNDNRIWFGKDGNSSPRLKRFLSEVKSGVVPKTIWLRDEVGDNQEAKREVKKFNDKDVFATPKPERLIERILFLATNEGDLVLDSFLGSGTTAAVAHKMNRRWIGIELGNHCYTHCSSRLEKVINGEDSSGITEKVNWKGGGGFKFYELAESLMVKDEKLGIYVINPKYSPDMIAMAICKIEGFRYAPKGYLHGYSSEKRFIHITTRLVNQDYLEMLYNELDSSESLLVYCTRRQGDLFIPDNIDIKRIPKDLIKKCTFERGE